MASGLIAHRVSLAELTDTFVQRKDVQDMMRLVERDLTDETDGGKSGLRAVGTGEDRARVGAGAGKRAGDAGARSCRTAAH